MIGGRAKGRGGMLIEGVCLLDFEWHGDRLHEF